MSQGNRLLRILTTSVVAAFAQWATKRTQKVGRDEARPVAQWRSSADEQASPGQVGHGATRDLTAQELAVLRPSYAPDFDGEPDPGEVVWTWVPYVENDGRGKDRPVLIIARIDSESWAACYLSTKEHRGFVSVGSGAWDSQGRESFLSPERVLRVTKEGMRRESAAVAKDKFVDAVKLVLTYHRLA